MGEYMMRDHRIYKFISVTMGFTIKKINIEVPHNTNNFIFIDF